MLLEVEGAVQSLKLESSQELHQVIHHCVETLCALRSSRGDRYRRPRVKPVEASISRSCRRYQVLFRLEDMDVFVCSDIPGKIGVLIYIVCHLLLESPYITCCI